LALGELIKELTSFQGDLIFIPVNNPNFHWSLLVYETSAKKFWHYDTLGGVNWKYIKTLSKELLQKIHSLNIELDKYLVKQHDIKQGNGYDCGVAVVAITKRIRELWKQGWWDWISSRKFKLGDELGEFDFGEERRKLREEYLKENREN
jgi:Ulp1 family protease